jgi:HEPN domain-containing protein
MDEAKLELVRAWMIKSGRDLESAARLAAGPDPLLDTAIYHCQQAGEKAVKGYLAFRDHPLEKSHNVKRLVLLAADYDARFSEWIDAGDLLTPHATAFRYPAEVLEPDEELYRAAEIAAKGLFQFVCSLLPAEAIPPKK